MNPKQWASQLLSAVIRGASHAGFAFMGLAVGHSMDATIPALNLKGLAIVLGTSALASLFKFLQDNPIPNDIEVAQAMEVIQKKVDSASKIYPVPPKDNP